jgi:hypothetical protein
MGGEYFCYLCDKLHGIQHYDHAGLKIMFNDENRHICSRCKGNNYICKKCGNKILDDHDCK